jgi:hypothetical protein
MDSAGEVVKLEILGATGSKIIFPVSAFLSQIKLDVSGLPKGLYILKADFSDGATRMEKIVKN